MPAASNLAQNLTPQERQMGTEYFDGRRKVYNYANNINFYTLLPPHIQNYARWVIRPCIDWSTGIVAGINDKTFATYTGTHLCDVAAALITGEKLFYEGDNECEGLLSNHWSNKVNFKSFHEKATVFALQAGTSIVKLDVGADYIPRPSAFRFDRTLFELDAYGEVVAVTFFIKNVTTTMSVKNGKLINSYWVIETRYYDGEGKKKAMYKVVKAEGLANMPVIPSPTSGGIHASRLPQDIKATLKAMRIEINTPIDIDYYTDGLGVWAVKATSKNNTVPDLQLGDPFLLKASDLLASYEFVFNSTNTDMYIGKGKILVPKSMLGQLRDNLNVTLGDVMNVAGYGMDEFVYVQVDYKDIEAQKPHPIQFELRAEDWERLWGLYIKAICARVELDVTSVFPEYATMGNKTATEVNSEDKLTRRTTLTKRGEIKPIMDRVVQEVCRLYGCSSDIYIRYSMSGITNEVEAAKNALSQFTANALSLYDYYKRTNVDANDSEVWELVERNIRWLMVKKELEGTDNMPSLDYLDGMTAYDQTN